MHKIGISVYPEKSSQKEVYDYLELASHYGFTRIFTCLLSVNSPKEVIIEEFGAFLQKAHSLGYEVAVDTNPDVFKHLDATPSDLSIFKKMGVDIIRLDGSFGTLSDIEITRNPYDIKIEFNGSFDQGVELLLKNGANKDQVTICHNFYPERYSGLDWELFKSINKHWKSLNLRTAAFVSSNADNTHGPWNVFCGLPTVEEMRGLPIDLQARYYLATGDIDDIIIGNAYADEEELKALSELNYQSLTIKMNEEEDITQIEKDIAYNFIPHWDRFDHSSYFLRSSMSRLNYKNTSIPYHPYPKDHFKKGDVLIVNDNLAHYRGELEIALRDIPNDKERNCIGHIDKDELGLLDLIKPGFHFNIKPKH
ncbi:MAG: DUF871 domain-containing protein [Eggerthia catenaformis]|uniref:DUF871 domain-containing protein n=1 Tax=Eggerthia catenaformis TaxID=31973 RepID=UPI00047A25C7|nr:MupG family TIM beta-alpha barrel fold protein [Eggerthia catenaformis]